VYPKQRFSSLAFITQQMLGKEICKNQTLTNWQRRPIRRNQSHYAAMDAAVVIKIYDKFVE
jgi:ribonuclease D